MEETVTITFTLKEYEDLVYDRRVLRALEASGVDNWEGYEDAMSELSEEG